MTTKVKVQIEVTEGFEDILALKQSREIEKFSKSAVLSVISDFTNDLKMMVNESRNLQKVEDQRLIEQEKI